MKKKYIKKFRFPLKSLTFHKLLSNSGNCFVNVKISQKGGALRVFRYSCFELWALEWNLGTLISLMQFLFRSGEILPFYPSTVLPGKLLFDLQIHFKLPSFVQLFSPFKINSDFSVFSDILWIILFCPNSVGLYFFVPHSVYTPSGIDAPRLPLRLISCLRVF